MVYSVRLSIRQRVLMSRGVSSKRNSSSSFSVSALFLHGSMNTDRRIGVWYKFF